MPDLGKIYREHPDDYERMIQYEDYQGNLLRTIESIHSLAGSVAVEFGAGTGRVTRLLAPHVRAIHAFDFTLAMLKVARKQLTAQLTRNWTLALGDHRAMPAAPRSADLAIEGWAFLQMAVWHWDRWQEVSGQALGEMRRVLRPGGTMILIETLGSGFEEPTIPDAFAMYYDWLEKAHGFERTWVRTDYDFGTPEEAAHWMRFFFGDELAEQQLASRSAIVPECTGIWWRRV
jgi:ubiquinone/menaquinone biosynthesis C-methylase UbiE